MAQNPNDVYELEDWFISLIDQVLDGEDDTPMPISKTIFGIPLVYNRVEHTMDVRGNPAVERWVYTFSRADGQWSMEMINTPADVERTYKWKATGDLEAARRDLSLLKLATT